MHTRFLCSLLFFLSICVSLFGQKGDLYIKAGQFYESGKSALLSNKAIHVQGKEIAEIIDFNAIPADAEIIDLTDYTVLPGLIDAHTHILFSQDATADFVEHSIHTLVMESDALRTLRGAKRARSYLDVGITGIKDLGNSGLFLDVALRDAIDEGSTVGPRIFASGPILAAAGGQIYGVLPAHQHIIDRCRNHTGVGHRHRTTRLPKHQGLHHPYGLPCGRRQQLQYANGKLQSGSFQLY